MRKLSKFAARLRCISQPNFFVYRIPVDNTVHEFTMASAFVPSSETNKMIAVSILYKEPPKSVQLKARASEKFTFLTSVQYSEPLVAKLYQAERVMTEKRCIDVSFLQSIKKNSQRCVAGNERNDFIRMASIVDV